MSESLPETVSVVIPTWNQSQLVRSALANLKNQVLRPHQVLVVDNGSTDETVAVARSSGAALVCLEQNRGFAAAVNAGVAAASGDWLLILNNDVELDPGWLFYALRAANEEKADFVTGKLLQARAPELIDGTWDLLSLSGNAWRCGWNAPDGELWNQRRSIHFASFTALLIRRAVFDKVGGLDTRYESYYEDVDFGLRSAAAGFTGVFEPLSIGKHLGSATLGRGSSTAFLVSRNQVLLAAKFDLWRISAWSALLGQAVFLLPQIRQGTLVAALRGKWAGFRLAAASTSEPVDRGRIAFVLKQSEAELFKFQRKIGFDLSWRIYFGLKPKPC